MVPLSVKRHRLYDSEIPEVILGLRLRLKQLLEERKDGDSIMIQPWPAARKYEKKIIEEFEILKEAVGTLRNIRKEKDIPHKEKLRLLVRDNDALYPGPLTPVLEKLASISGIEFTDEKIDNAISFRIKTIEFYIPVEDKVDFQEEIEVLRQELEYTKGFLKSVMVKLNNEKFVKNAPAAVIEKERKKREDAENKIRLLEERLRSME